MVLSRRWFLAVLGVGAITASCGGGGDATSDSGPGGEVVVVAAASLTGAFTEIGDAFELANPGTEVTFSFGSSSDLARQLDEGAPGDVFASADEVNMDKVVESGGVLGSPEIIATNAMEIIVAPGNPLGIESLDDLSDPDLIVVVAAPEVPAGRYAAQVLDRAGVELIPRSLEESVRAVVAKVVAGEVDAGIAYVTDVRAAGEGASGVAIPDEVNVVARYPIAVTSSGANPESARAFVDFVSGPSGQEILQRAGFGPP